MKKLMFVLAFAGIGLFANASNLKKAKSIDIAKVSTKTITEKKNRTLLIQYSFSFYCNNGNVVVGCCYSTYEAARMAALDAYYIACGPIPAEN